MNFSRFDIPKSVANLLKVAIDNNVIDALDVYALGVDYAGNWRDVAGALCEYSYCTNDQRIHSKVVQAAEEVWKTIK